jgi:hypothetical protein
MATYMGIGLVQQLWDWKHLEVDGFSRGLIQGVDLSFIHSYIKSRHSKVVLLYKKCGC